MHTCPCTHVHTHRHTHTWTCAHKRKRGKDGGREGRRRRESDGGQARGREHWLWKVHAWSAADALSYMITFWCCSHFWVCFMSLPLLYCFFSFLVCIILLHFKLPWILSGIRSNTRKYKQLPPSLAGEHFHVYVTQKHIKWWIARNKRFRSRAPSVTVRHLLLASSLAETSGTTNKCHQKLLVESRDREWAQKDYIQECRIIGRNDLMHQTGH